MLIEGALAYLITANSAVDPELAAAVAFAESSLRCELPANHVGAVGLMQVRPVAAEAAGMPGADLTDCATNIRAGTRYLARLIDRYGVFDGLRAYNCGPTGARRRSHCGRSYARKVLRVRDQIRATGDALPW
jgi:soluble lytic murein transglycosylase-like protein